MSTDTPAPVLAHGAPSLATGEDTAASQYARGNELRRQGEYEAAEHALRRALALEPRLFDARLSLAFLYRDLGRLDEAVSLFDPWLQSRPDDAILLGRVARLLDALGDRERALSCYEQSIARDDTLAPSWFERGRLLLQQGQFDEAARSFDRTLALDPDYGAAYLLLVQTRRFTKSDPWIEVIEGHARRITRSSATGACLHFARGKIHDDLGQWEAALAEIEAANDIRHQEVPFDRAQCDDRVKRLLAIPQGFWVAPEPLPPKIAPEPFFIVGLPRTGTTLFEHLLTTHPAIATTGESDHLPLLLDALGLPEPLQASRTPGPGFPRSLTAKERLQAIADYRTELTRGTAPDTRYVIDKNPLNFWNLGPIHKLFPHAPIVAVERDPRDVLLSLYFQNFDRAELAFSYSIPDILFYLDRYRILMNHWQNVLGIRLRILRYETLVREPTTVVDEILGWLGLAPTGAQEPVERDQVVIRTASTWQARQPIYQRSVGRWKPYAGDLVTRHPELARLGFSS